MALQSTINTLKDLLGNITQDLSKAEAGNKAASQRVRTMTVRLEKVAKHYRKESISSEKGLKGVKRPARRSTTKPKAKPMIKSASAKLKSKPKTKSAMAKPKAFALKRPAAKSSRKASFR